LPPIEPVLLAPEPGMTSPAAPQVQMERAVRRVMRWRMRIHAFAVSDADSAATNTAASTNSPTPPAKDEKAESLGHFAEPDDDLCEQLGDYDCPVCLEIFCEPVVAGCGRHAFCKNCLLRSQRIRTPPRCPVCRKESRPPASEIPEVPWLVEKLEILDPTYKKRVEEAQKDRERDFAPKKAASKTNIEVSVPRVPNGVLERDGLSSCTCGSICSIM